MSNGGARHSQSPQMKGGRQSRGPIQKLHFCIYCCIVFDAAFLFFPSSFPGGELIPGLTTVDALLKTNFYLQINDRRFLVRTPLQGKRHTCSCLLLTCVSLFFLFLHSTTTCWSDFIDWELLKHVTKDKWPPICCCLHLPPLPRNHPQETVAKGFITGVTMLSKCRLLYF